VPIIDLTLEHLYDTLTLVGVVVDEHHGWGRGKYEDLGSLCEGLKEEITHLLEGGK